MNKNSIKIQLLKLLNKFISNITIKIYFKKLLKMKIYNPSSL